MASFTQDIAKFVEKTKIKGETVLRKLAFEAFQGCVQKSPVDTGRFRSNWRIGINKVDKSFTWVPPKTAPKGQSPVTGVETALALGKISKAGWGDFIAITNNLPYGPKLENGWSRQAPAGMMKLTFEEVKAGLARAVASLPP